MPIVFCTVMEVITETAYPPKADIVCISACTPAQLVLSEPVIVRTVFLRLSSTLLNICLPAKENKKIDIQKFCSRFDKENERLYKGLHTAVLLLHMLYDLYKKSGGCYQDFKASLLLA